MTKMDKRILLGGELKCGLVKRKQKNKEENG
jgi:hypothetical protein